MSSPVDLAGARLRECGVRVPPGRAVRGLAVCGLAVRGLVELCGAFSHDEVAALRRLRPELPVGLVGYAGDMTAGLHALFGD
ncbi:hypothetical protein EDD30_4544 [Couchioplanes caeruleus]|uniref:Uncharacterized protein n=2 Tax=Couchioplanes caeruleus TaxID=56438 RepID=A0A1K0FFP4_9ACTN|nr:hypothetical protein BG844_25180 [Couchioplanes caeruleus subsp. caeruleus]ROP31622.1 hypothetical protein EDD30_4544 [Couchioplanes caeruleus]